MFCCYSSMNVRIFLKSFVETFNVKGSGNCFHTAVLWFTSTICYWTYSNLSHLCKKEQCTIYENIVHKNNKAQIR